MIKNSIMRFYRKNERIIDQLEVYGLYAAGIMVALYVILCIVAVYSYKWRKVNAFLFFREINMLYDEEKEERKDYMDEYENNDNRKIEIEKLKLYVEIQKVRFETGLISKPYLDHIMCDCIEQLNHI